MPQEILVDQNHNSKKNRGHESFLTPFFVEMNLCFPDQWCVLHSYETLPFYSESDVDMAFAGTDLDKLEQLIKRIGEQNGWKVYQKLWYDVQWCCYYVLKEVDTGVLLAIDFLIDNQGIGRYGFKTTLLTSKCNRVQEIIPVPNHEIAFLYKLVKRIEKGRALSEDREYLLAHYELSDFTQVAPFLEDQYGISGQKLLLDFLDNNRTLTSANMSFLKKERKRLIFNLKSRFNYTYWETRRVLYRFYNPSGLIVKIPIMEEELMAAFTGRLEEKVGILFRFVKLDVKNSRKDRLLGVSGSTLMVCPKRDFKKDEAVQYHGVFRRFLALEVSENFNFEDLGQMVNAYYELIIKALWLRSATK